MGKRTWFKIFSDKWLEGTIRNESPELRGIWIDLLALASSMDYGDIGEIKLKNSVGLTDNQIAKILNIRQEIWTKNKDILSNPERGFNHKGARIKVNSDNIIKIVNWQKYQSEYSRQKDYRKKVTNESYNTELQPKVTKQKEKEKKRKIKEREKEFDIFYSSYPIHQGRKKSLEKWNKKVGDNELPSLEILLIAIEKQKNSKKWQEEQGKYIPYPATWLHNDLWEDEVEENNGYT